MRADIHDGPEQMLQSKAGYIDARPLTANPTNLLATHGRTIHSGQSRRFDRPPATSGLPRLADILSVRWHVSKVPTPDIGIPIAGGPGVHDHAGFCFPVPLSARVNSRTSFNSSSPSTSDTTRSAPTLLTTGTAKFMNLRSSDDRESGRSASPSGTSTVSRKD